MVKLEHEANRHDGSARKVAPAPPAPMSVRQVQQQRPGFLQRKKRRVLETLFALSLMGLLVALIFLGGGFLAERLTSLIPINVDVQLGQAYAQSLVSSGRVCPYQPGQQALRQFAQPLLLASGSVDYPFSFHLVQDDVPNAYALPGGQVMVTQALIEQVQRPDELAGVLAHEIQHVKLRHSMKTLMRQLGTSAALSVVLGGSSSIFQNLGASQLVELSYGREAEREADRAGAQTLQALGYDPLAFTKLLQRISQKQGLELPPFLSSHPRADEREVLLVEFKESLWPPEFKKQVSLAGIKCYADSVEELGLDIVESQ